MVLLRILRKGIMATLLIVSIIFFIWGPVGAAEPIKFGVSTAISGDAAAYGKPFLDAIQMMANIFIVVCSFFLSFPLYFEKARSLRGLEPPGKVVEPEFRSRTLDVARQGGLKETPRGDLIPWLSPWAN